MSWKSLITASLLCVLASPAFATPTVTLTNAGLNAQGNWIWNVAITNTDAGGGVPPGGAGGSALAAELGFRATSANVISVSNAAPTNWDFNDPGASIFPSWEVTYNYNGNVAPEGIEANFAGATTSGCPGACTGNVINAAPSGPTGAIHAATAVNGGTNEISAYLGSVNFATLGPHPFLQIITKGPTAASANDPTTTRKTVLQMLGAYSGNGRIAELTDATHSTNYSSYADLQNRPATPGDTDLVNGVNGTDFGTVLDNFGKNEYWQGGNFHANDGTAVNGTDFGIVLDAFGKLSGVQSAGSGSAPDLGGASLGASSVPEPTSIFLFGLGFFTLLGARRR